MIGKIAVFLTCIVGKLPCTKLPYIYLSYLTCIHMNACIRTFCFLVKICFDDYNTKVFLVHWSLFLSLSLWQCYSYDLSFLDVYDLISCNILTYIGASAFTKSTRALSTTSLNVKSKSVPFLEQPAKLDGSMAGDVGFDPAGFLNMKRFKYTKGTDGKMFAGWTEDIDW